MLSQASCGESSTPEVCDATTTDLGGEIHASLTLKRACSPYHLRSQNGTFGATVLGAGVVLTIEDGVQVLADAKARLELKEGGRLLAGRAGGQRVVFDRADSAGDAWAGITLGNSAPIVHELHQVTLRAAQGTPAPEGGYAVLSLIDSNASPRTGAVLDDVVIESPADIGLRVYREGSYLAAGTTRVTVHGAGGYPVVMDAQNLPGLPPNQDLKSNDPQKQRILIFGGNQGDVTGDLVWSSQTVPIEVGVDLSIGTPAARGSLTVTSPQTVLLRKDVDLRMDNGALIAKGERDCKDTGDCSIVFDTASPGERWAAFIFIAGATSNVASDSTLQRVKLAAGGGTGSTAMVTIQGPGIPGVAGDCSRTAVITGSYLTSEASAGCLTAQDSNNAYASDNGFKSCGADVKCD
jgi:hypothetical protein